MSYFPIIVFMSISLLYLRVFGIDLRNPNLTDWVNVATYFNNAFSPFLLLVTVVLLYKTWDTSKTELEETKKELKIQNTISRYPHHIDIVRHRLKTLEQNLKMNCSSQLVDDAFVYFMCLIQENREALDKLSRFQIDWTLGNAPRPVHHDTPIEKYPEKFKKSFKYQIELAMMNCYQDKETIVEKFSNDGDLQLCIEAIVSLLINQLLFKTDPHLYDEVHALEQYKMLITDIVNEQDEELQKLLKKEVDYYFKPKLINALDTHLRSLPENNELLGIYRNLHRTM
ncbi:hypothetical protein J8M01_19230 [Pseudoalteromonas sp. MMG005]|nr:hypothetical protein [Pseudoalteromonas sp. MMG005]